MAHKQSAATFNFHHGYLKWPVFDWSADAVDDRLKFLKEAPPYPTANCKAHENRKYFTIEASGIGAAHLHWLPNCLALNREPFEALGMALWKLPVKNVSYDQLRTQEQFIGGGSQPTKLRDHCSNYRLSEEFVLKALYNRSGSTLYHYNVTGDGFYRETCTVVVVQNSIGGNSYDFYNQHMTDEMFDHASVGEDIGTTLGSFYLRMFNNKRTSPVLRLNCGVAPKCMRAVYMTNYDSMLQAVCPPRHNNRIFGFNTAKTYVMTNDSACLWLVKPCHGIALFHHLMGGTLLFISVPEKYQHKFNELMYY